ncbi:MAG: type II secretion system minor pseudopilin GspJ [Pseudomonadota bacterium]
MRTGSRPASGFTLVEVMISLVIFSLIATMCYTALTQATRASASITDQMQALQELQRTLQTLASDIAQAQPRPVREPVGDAWRGAFLADGRDPYLLEVTRNGYANPLGMPRATSQRVAYRLEEEQLIRTQWPVLDSVLATEPVDVVLLEDVIRVEFRYLGDGPDSWTAEWPPGFSGGANANAPRAVELTIEHNRWGEMRRLIEIGS